jgi:hypothetical protein
VLAFTAVPRSHWSKIWSTNPLERVDKEIKGRARVAVRADVHDEWQSGDRRRFSEGSMALLRPNGDSGTVAAINSGE